MALGGSRRRRYARNRRVSARRREGRSRQGPSPGRGRDPDGIERPEADTEGERHRPGLPIEPDETRGRHSVRLSRDEGGPAVPADVSARSEEHTQHIPFDHIPGRDHRLLGRAEDRRRGPLPRSPSRRPDGRGGEPVVQGRRKGWARKREPHFRRRHSPQRQMLRQVGHAGGQQDGRCSRRSAKRIFRRGGYPIARVAHAAPTVIRRAGGRPPVSDTGLRQQRQMNLKIRPRTSSKSCKKDGGRYIRLNRSTLDRLPAKKGVGLYPAAHHTYVNSPRRKYRPKELL
mmetsp:Transcript_53944/g.161455  ORF Transcript_53944/g.161455 Transcript_53944/m.161455 type:complete len:286 (+) Transcript_53944:1315-2172(+)